MYLKYRLNDSFKFINAINKNHKLNTYNEPFKYFVIGVPINIRVAFTSFFIFSAPCVSISIIMFWPYASLSISDFNVP